MSGTFLDLIAIIEFFPYRTDAHIREPEWNFVTAWVIIQTFYEMDFIVNAEFDFANILAR